MPKCIIKMKDGGSLSPDKAKLILSEGQANGRKLTNKQKRYMGWVAGGKAESGANIQQLSDNPYSSPMLQFNGPGHESGGIDIDYGGQKVEVEGEETAFVDQAKNLVILGNLNVPGTKMKFKNAGKQIAKEEVKTLKQMDKSMQLINAANPYDPFERLKFNSGMIMAKGAEQKQKELSLVKEGLSGLQDDILEQADMLGVNPKQLQKGKAKFGVKLLAQEGQTVPFPMRTQRAPIQGTNDFFNSLTPVQPAVPQVINNDGRKGSLAQRNNNPGNLKYAPWMKKYGAVPSDPGKDGGQFAKFPSLQQGQQAMVALIKDPSYQKRTVEDAITRWTGGSPYSIIPAELKGKKVSDLNPNELNILYNTITQGEDSKQYNWEGVTPNPTPTPNTPDTPWQRQDLELIRGVQNRPFNLNIDSGLLNTNPQVQTPSTTVTQTTTIRPAFKNPLRFGQIAPEVLTIATERASFVPGQRFEPQLYQPYQVSFQDQLNENQATFNSVSRQLGGNRNTSALSALAAQKYQADSQVLANEFRTNQGITNEVTNKNIALLNQTQLTNLQLDDTQFVRQEQAQTNTRNKVRAAVQSISDKIQMNRMENVDYNANQQVLFSQYSFDNTGQVGFIPNQGLVIGGNSASAASNPYERKRVEYDKQGEVRKTIINTPSPFDQEGLRNKRFFEEAKKRRQYDPRLFKST